MLLIFTVEDALDQAFEISPKSPSSSVRLAPHAESTPVGADDSFGVCSEVEVINGKDQNKLVGILTFSSK